MKLLEDLIDGKLPPHELKKIISSEKDKDRFFKILEILQKRVKWPEKILLPLTDKLYVVQKGEGRIVKCECGYEFCDYMENWKHKSRVLVRDTKEKLQEIYPPLQHSNPEYMVLREFYCPGCFTLLEVEAVPPGYPVIFDFIPDIDGFYKK
jgi:acetone carboxylase gamma subunit